MSENLVLKREVNGKVIKIVYDMDRGDSPREWDNLGTIVAVNHRRYTIGDDITDIETIQELIKDKNNIVLPVYMYEHGNIALSTSGFSDSWDSGQIGIIYVTKAKIKSEYGKVTKKTIAQAIECMQNEIKTYSQYLNGEVYGFIIESQNGEHIDSCFGFYGTPDEIIEEQMVTLLEPYTSKQQATLNTLDQLIKSSKGTNKSLLEQVKTYVKGN